ncbi:hypothetical protein CsatB_000475 [Cannabis sativa]
MDSFANRVEGDDKEVLNWAAIERLPTYERLKQGILDTCTVDVHHLSIQQKKSLVEKLIKVPDQHNQTFLAKLKNRIHSVRIELPTVEVRFEHLIVETEIYVGKELYLHSLTSQRMSLSSGKTTLLLALAGQLDPGLKVTYNGHDLDEFIPKRTTAYVSEHDSHIKEMTVRETLDFSARCQGVTRRYELLAELCRREKEANIKPDPDIDVFMKAATTEGQETSVVTDYVLKILGLDVCANTIIGDDLIRGISGGQRK